MTKDNTSFNQSFKSFIDQVEQFQNERRLKSSGGPATYHQHGLTSDDLGGRFRTTEKKPVVVGSINDPATQYPRASSNWTQQQLPPEMPLGYSVDAVESNEAYPGEAQTRTRPMQRRMVKR